MCINRSAVVVLLVVPLTLLLALPGAPGLAQPAEDRPGGPAYLTGPNDGAPQDIAAGYVRREAASFGLSDFDVAELGVLSSYESRHTGVTHVNLMQQLDELDVFGAVSTVTIAPDGSVVFVGNAFVPGLEAASGRARTEAAEAVEAAARALGLDEPEDLEVIEQDDGPAEETVLTDGGISAEPIPARLGWQPTPRGLRLAWQVVIDDVSDVHLWNAAVDAETGRLLGVEDWTSHDNHDDLEAGLGRAGTSSLATGPASPDPVIDGSSYDVVAFPAESPNDGPRSVVSNPADGLASPFGWHDTDGAPGPEFTTVRGNNVHAYTDRSATNTPDPGGEPDGGASLTFEFPADLEEHPHAYTDAATTNLFYASNVTHDVLYRYGFDEPAGNFQVNNYGRGGVGGDHLRAEAADGGGMNNANFSTPAADGGAPRMQMFLWTPGGLPMAVTVSGGPAAGTHLANFARFGPAPSNLGTTGPLVDVADACAPFSLTAGVIALIDRTASCTVAQQVINAQTAGAAAVLSATAAPGSPGIISGAPGVAVGIPTVGIDGDTAAALRAGLPAVATVHRNQDVDPMRDGDLDNAIIVHEYTHGLSLRLTGGPGINCLSGTEQMGEGWSDWYALALLIDPALDDPDGPRGIATYPLYEAGRHGDGLRPLPYSRNMEINPFTYDNIKSGSWNGGSLAVPHGVGWGWASVLWDLTWDLIDEHGFNPNIYEPWDTGGNNLALQLVTDGLKMQGCGPGFVVGRNAIIAADTALTGGENHCLLWAAFARRGLGFSAVQGTTSRNDNTEAFDLPDVCVPAPVLDLDPGSLWAGVHEGGTATRPLAIGNIVPLGGGTLDWTLVEAETDCSTPSDVAWLSVDTTAGSTAAGDTSNVDVGFDTAGLVAPDAHEALLCLETNDPGAPLVAVPVTLQVQYPMSSEDFGAPIVGPPSLNSARAGQSVPVKFSLGGHRGPDILAPGSPTSQAADCETFALSGSPVAATSPGGQGLQYDASTDSYRYVWQTQRAWAGTCRAFQLTLDDGSTHTAYFSFR